MIRAHIMTTIEHRISVFFFTHSTLRNKNKGKKKKAVELIQRDLLSTTSQFSFSSQMPLNRLIKVNPASSYNKSYGAPPSLIRNGDRKNASTAMSPWNAADRSSWWRSHILPSISQLCTGAECNVHTLLPPLGSPRSKAVIFGPSYRPRGCGELKY